MSPFRNRNLAREIEHFGLMTLLYEVHLQNLPLPLFCQRGVIFQRGVIYWEVAQCKVSPSVGWVNGFGPLPLYKRGIKGDFVQNQKY